MNSSKFLYPPLPTEGDGIRILILVPGDFGTTIVAQLMSLPFRQKPKYAALSYTWEASHPDMAPLNPRLFRDTFSIMQIDLNGQPFFIRDNLWLALQHLRSMNKTVYLWVDAICINQNDIQERNAQVTLMADIYRRAFRVFAWVGLEAFAPNVLLTILPGRWERGMSKGAAVPDRIDSPFTNSADNATSSVSSRFCYSQEPSRPQLQRIVESTYWSRMWIVQETCRPRRLDVVFGALVWPFERLWGWAEQSSFPPEILLPMQRVALTRAKQGSSWMTLENLMEYFLESGCSEAQDNIFGLLGCSVDIHAIPGQPQTVAQLKKTTTVAPPSASPERRGIGLFLVDYKRGFYDIWSDILRFCYFQADPVDLIERSEGLIPFANVDERRLTVVRTAALIQAALQQKVAEECGKVPITNSKPWIAAVGYFAGSIAKIGPQYSALVGTLEAGRDWERTWVDYYKNDVQRSDSIASNNERMDKLHWIEHTFMEKIMNCADRDIHRVRNLRYSDTDAMGCMKLAGQVSSDAAIQQAYMDLWSSIPEDDKTPSDPYICVGTDNLMALVPSGARPGDVVVRFWNCNAAMVMRPCLTSSRQSTKKAWDFLLVGSAEVAEVEKRVPGQLFDRHAEHCMNNVYPDCGVHSEYAGIINIVMGMGILQAITAYTRV